MAIKLGRMTNYFKRLLSIKFHSSESSTALQKKTGNFIFSTENDFLKKLLIKIKP